MNSNHASTVRARRLILALTVIIAGWAAIVSPASATGPFEGQWNGVGLTDTGQAPISLTLRQTGVQVTGMYQARGRPSDVDGLVAGNVLMLRILNAREQIQLTLGADGRTLTGDGIGATSLRNIRLTK